MKIFGSLAAVWRGDVSGKAGVLPNIRYLGMCRGMGPILDIPGPWSGTSLRVLDWDRRGKILRLINPDVSFLSLENFKIMTAVEGFLLWCDDQKTVTLEKF